ncbi:MAG: NYN domain-containing protein [Ilumatobacteraceae bacterium]
MIHTHVVIDGSNLATEGRTQPSLRQLREAVSAFAAEHPSAKLTIVVDATFGHRIDPSEVSEFDAAVSSNELVAPPAGAVGRGDAFVLGIADKVSAVVLSNDSYQEFHGQYSWLFDEGRLVGGKPVPHVGWVFVYRVPVRGPLSRKSVSEAKRKGRRNTGPTAADSSNGSVRVGSAAASRPMPVPTAPPPGAVLAAKGRKKAAPAPEPAAGTRTGTRTGKKQAAATAGATAAAPASASAPAGRPPANGPLNDFVAYLAFVERHPVGATVTATVDHYSSHGAYVRIGDVWGYVPLRLMADPPPRSARAHMKVGADVTLVVHEYVAAKRSIDLAVPGAVKSATGRARGGAASSAASTDGLRKAAGTATGAGTKKVASTKPASTKAGSKKAGSPAAQPVARAAKKASAAKTPAKKSATSASTSTRAAKKPATGAAKKSSAASAKKSATGAAKKSAPAKKQAAKATKKPRSSR